MTDPTSDTMTHSHGHVHDQLAYECGEDVGPWVEHTHASPQPDTAPEGPTSDLAEVLHQALRHFVHLDESNAAIHCAPVRYSPITFRLAEQTEALTVAPGDEFAARVLDHVGQYEEDTGR